jgi:hypothetical protein
MNDNSYTTRIVRNGRTLILFVANLRDELPTTPDIERTVKKAFDGVSEQLKEKVNVLYIRDNFDQSIEGGMYWSVRMTGTNEAIIAIPRWSEDKTQVEHLSLAINEACYGLVRAQYSGVPCLFGDEVLSRGFAALYAESVTSYEYPIDREITKYMRSRMLNRWFRIHAGPNKSWTAKLDDLRMATLVGYELAHTLCGDDNPKIFCLEESVKMFGILRTDDILWTLNHPKRRRSARILSGKARRPSTLREKVLMLLPAVG